MEKQHYILKLSLKQIALRKVAIVLWTDPEIFSLIKTFSFKAGTHFTPFMEERLTSLAKKVEEKVPILLLPDSLRDELMSIIPAIGSEILKWKKYQLPECDATNEFEQLCWTSQGTVDYPETAKRLIRQKRVGISSTYRLSSLNCLDEDIRVIWRELSEDCKERFYKGVERTNRFDFWAYVLSGNTCLCYLIDQQLMNPIDEPVRTLFQTAFESAAVSDNKVATEYFFRRLTSQEREACLVETAQRVVNERGTDQTGFKEGELPLENVSAVLNYLLSQMSEEEQIEVFKKHPLKTLRCFLKWPWQDLFVKVAAIVLPLLSIKEFESTLMYLAGKRSRTVNKWKVFGDFFLLAPIHYRNGVLGKHETCTIWLRHLLLSNNVECIKLVLRSVDSTEKERLITARPIVSLCFELINWKQWVLLKLFVEECELSNEAKTRVKNCFMNFLSGVIRGSAVNISSAFHLEKFLQIIDNASVFVCNKRCIEESEEKEQSTLIPKKR